MAWTGGPTLGLDDAAYQRAQSEIHAVHDDLVDQRRAVTRLMDALFDGGWTGVAADQFATGWADWQEGCGEVLDGLAAMHESMTSVFWSLHASDDQQRGSMTRLRQRLANGAGGPA